MPRQQSPIWKEGLQYDFYPYIHCCRALKAMYFPNIFYEVYIR